MIEEIRNIFLSEASGQLEMIEAISNGKEVAGQENGVELIHRIMHTMKGSAPMFGYQHVADLASAVELSYKHFLVNEAEDVPNSVKNHISEVASVMRECLSTLENPDDEVLQRKNQLIDYFNQLQ